MGEYYIICEKISLDSNQWGILIGAIGVLLTLVGFGLAFIIYKIQRKDSSKDAFSFFQDSLPTLKVAIENTIENLEVFILSLENDEENFTNPVLSVSLNDNFLDRINVIDLNRFYVDNKKDKFDCFRNFLIDANFFGDYHNYFTNEIDYFRNNYLEKEKIYSKWQLLRSNKFFSSITDNEEREDYKEFYGKWVMDLQNNSSVFEMNENNIPIEVKNRTELVKQVKFLGENVFQFIQYSEKANEINLIANEVNSSFNDIIHMKKAMCKVMKSDIDRFKRILTNLNQIIEIK